MIEGRRQQPTRRSPERMRRQVIILTILLIAVLVMLFYFKAWLDGLAEGRVTIEPERVPLVEPTPEPEPIVERGIEAASPAEVPVGSPAVAPMSPLIVVLLPVHAEIPDPSAAMAADSIRQATLRALRGMPNVEVIDVGPAELAAVAAGNAGSLRSDRVSFTAVERQYGDVTAAELEVTARDGGWSIGMEVRRSSGGGLSMGAGGSDDGTPASSLDADSIGRRFAEEIAHDDAWLFVPIAAAAKNVLFDAARSEEERAQALVTLGNRRLDSESIAGGVAFAAQAASAETRKLIWSVLRQSGDASLVQPLSNALLSDPDAAVRAEAALGLVRYLDTPVGQAALAQAAGGDGSPEVRLAARMVMMDADQRQDFARETLLDRNLTAAERMAPKLLFAGERGFGLSGSFNSADAAEEALAYAEVIGATETSDVTLAALSALQHMTTAMQFGRQRFDLGPEVVSALIETAESTDERVRRAALGTMRSHAQNPEIRAALESVRATQPELANELRIAEALARNPSVAGVLP